MKEGKDAVHLWWEDYGHGQPAKGTSLRPVHKTDTRMPFLWKNLFHV